MKICILTHTFPRFEGDIAAPFMYGVAKGMVEAGNQVFVLTPFNEKFNWKKKELPFKLITYKYIWPISLHRLGYSETLTNDMGFSLLMWLLSPFMYIFGMLNLFLLVRKEKIDVINAHWILPNGFIATVVSFVTGTPVVSTLPGSDVYMVQKNMFFNILGRYATWRSKWITSNSGQLINDLQKFTGINLENKSSSIIYGVDPNKFKENNSKTKELKKKLKIAEKSIVIVGVGRLVAKKGFRYLIEASKLILKKNPGLTFVIVGDGDERSFLESLAKKLGVYDNFRFVGSIDYTNLIYYYNLADIYILPSVRDEKGNLDDQSVSVIEAMSSGTPVITTDFPGYRLVVKDSYDGYLVKEKEYKEIARCISYLVNNKSVRDKFGKNARASVLKNFSWKAIGEKYTSLFVTLDKSFYSVGVPKILIENDRLRIGKQIWNVLRNEVGDGKNKKCLDIGSSTGVISGLMAEYFKEVQAVDVDKKAIEIAKYKYTKKNLNFGIMDGENLNFKDNSFDVVICNQVYNFTKNPQKLMDEIYRVLKKGGVCFFGARNKYAIMEPQYNLPFLSWMPSLLPFGKNYMSYWELRILVKKFEMNDYTVKILKDPKKYGFSKLGKYVFITKHFPFEMVYGLIPNYIWILKK